jgi:hypothetical protein
MIVQYDTERQTRLCKCGVVLQQFEGTPNDGETYAPIQPDVVWAASEADLAQGSQGEETAHDVYAVDDGTVEVYSVGTCRPAV